MELEGGRSTHYSTSISPQIRTWEDPRTLEAGGWLSWQVESTGSQVYAGPPGGRILTSQPSRAPGVQFPELAPGQAGDIPLPSLVTTRVLLGLD